MKKTILGSFAAAALVSGAVYAAPCDPCGDVAACDPCGVAACNPCDEAACGPCDDADSCGPKRSKLKVYTDVAMLVGNVDGGFTPANVINYTLAGGVKATIGVQRGKNAVELGYTGLYNNLSTTLMPIARAFANYNAVDVNFVRTLERNKNLKAFVGVGYANFTQNYLDVAGGFVILGTPAGSMYSSANDMAGFHVGGKWSRSVNRIGLETYGKLGVYANTSTESVNGVTVFQNGNVRGAWVAAGGINLTYKLTKRLTSYVGYDVTKIEGVERGLSNIAGRNVADDGVLIQGLALGVKAAF